LWLGIRRIETAAGILVETGVGEEEKKDSLSLGRWDR
jgi:hypothetical protein